MSTVGDVERGRQGGRRATWVVLWGVLVLAALALGPVGLALLVLAVAGTVALTPRVPRPLRVLLLVFALVLLAWAVTSTLDMALGQAVLTRTG